MNATRPLSEKRREILAVLAAATPGQHLTAGEIFNACTQLKDRTNCSQALIYMRDRDEQYVHSFGSGSGNFITWTITEAGRAALLADPGIDPGHTDADEPEAEEEEEEIDFALWASGVLQIQIGDNSFTVPAKHVARLGAYLEEHARGEEMIFVPTSYLNTLRDSYMKTALVSLSPVCTRPEGLDKAPGTVTTIAGSAPAATPTAPACPLPPIDATLVAGLAPIASDPPPGAAFKLNTHADVLRIDLAKPLTAGNAAFDRLGTPAIGTEAIGRPEVNLDGPNGIGGTAGPREELSHGMTREEQYAETAGRG